MKIVFAIDSFKGSISSIDAAEAAERGARKALGNFESVKIAIADGGEGTLEALAQNGGAKLVSCETFDPLMRPIRADFALLENNCAVVELAKASGITLLKKGELNPLKTSTYGTGLQIKDAIKSGARKFALAIGSSATNDAGTGIMAALGFEFLDAKGEKIEIPSGESLERISEIRAERALPELKDCEFTILCDVKNPFVGESGAARVFAPQKGASAEGVERLESGMANFAKVVKETFGRDISMAEGAGAAGGVGGAFLAFFNAKLKSGIDGILDALNFEKLAEGADFVVTGEGKLDSQSAMGKAPCGVARRAKGAKVIAICGSLESAEELYERGVSAMFSVCPKPMELGEAMWPENAAKNMEKLCENIFRLVR